MAQYDPNRNRRRRIADGPAQVDAIVDLAESAHASGPPAGALAVDAPAVAPPVAIGRADTAERQDRRTAAPSRIPSPIPSPVDQPEVSDAAAAPVAPDISGGSPRPVPPAEAPPAVGTAPLAPIAVGAAVLVIGGVVGSVLLRRRSRR